MNPKFIDKRLSLLESEETHLERELKRTPITEFMTIKGRVRKTVENRLNICQREIKQLKAEKARTS